MVIVVWQRGRSDDAIYGVITGYEKRKVVKKHNDENEKEGKTDYDLRRWRQLCNLYSNLKIDDIPLQLYIFM